MFEQFLFVGITISVFIMHFCRFALYVSITSFGHTFISNRAFSVYSCFDVLSVFAHLDVDLRCLLFYYYFNIF